MRRAPLAALSAAAFAFAAGAAQPRALPPTADAPAFAAGVARPGALPPPADGEDGPPGAAVRLGARPGPIGAPPPARAPCGAFAAPPAALLRALAFGQPRALARALWSRARVAHGTCLARGLRFRGAAAYVEAALDLDPAFREPYRYVEAFVVDGAAPPSRGELAFVRGVLDAAVGRFPGDREMLARSAAFLAFVAPPHLAPTEARAWRAEGLRRLGAAP
jgi:hypothetical protein